VVDALHIPSESVTVTVYVWLFVPVKRGCALLASSKPVVGDQLYKAPVGIKPLAAVILGKVLSASQ
jgi:hypothetical protein